MKLGDYSWYKAEVKFNVNNKPVMFNIIHNMDENTFYAALESWQARTRTFTDYSFCDYIMTKESDNIAFTENDYELLSK